MSKADDKTIIITIVMPPDKPTTLIMQRGDLAVTHTYLGNIPGGHNDRNALDHAYDRLTALEANPPVVPALPAEKPKSKTKRGKGTRAQAAQVDQEPTIDVPLAKGTQAVKISHIKIVGGESDAVAYRQAVTVAGLLIDGGLWDGESQIRFEDVYATAKKIKGMTPNEIGSLFTLEEFVQTGEAQQP